MTQTPDIPFARLSGVTLAPAAGPQCRVLVDQTLLAAATRTFAIRAKAVPR